MVQGILDVMVKASWCWKTRLEASFFHGPKLPLACLGKPAKTKKGIVVVVDIKPEFGKMYIATWRLETKDGTIFVRQPSFIDHTDEIGRKYNWVRIHFEPSSWQDKMQLTVTMEKGEPVEFEPVGEIDCD